MLNISIKLKLAAVALMALLITGCGGSTTVADVPNNFSGNYTGTVNNQAGGSDPATLNLIQSSSTTGTGDAAVTTITIRGLLVIRPSDICEISIDITEGTANTNSIIVTLGSSTTTNGSGDDAVTNTSDSGDMALTASGNALSGNIRYTPDIENGSCPRPSGAVSFFR